MWWRSERAREESCEAAAGRSAAVGFSAGWRRMCDAYEEAEDRDVRTRMLRMEIEGGYGEA
eukprot:137296-Rhodomonas_salina.1